MNKVFLFSNSISTNNEIMKVQYCLYYACNLVLKVLYFLIFIISDFQSLRLFVSFEMYYLSYITQIYLESQLFFHLLSIFQKPIEVQM